MVFSGIFCAMDHIVQTIIHDKEVDVFNAVKKIRQSNPDFIFSLVSLRLEYNCDKIRPIVYTPIQSTNQSDSIGLMVNLQEYNVVVFFFSFFFFFC